MEQAAGFAGCDYPPDIFPDRGGFTGSSGSHFGGLPEDLLHVVFARGLVKPEALKREYQKGNAKRGTRNGENTKGREFRVPI